MIFRKHKTTPYLHHFVRSALASKLWDDSGEKFYIRCALHESGKHRTCVLCISCERQVSMNITTDGMIRL